MSEKEQNRAKHPDIAEAVDRLREHFGDVRVTELKPKND